jgi:hypothetical protein
MFYYLFYNSSFTFIVENRLFSTILYGSIIYIISHAILHYCQIDILSIIKNYFWTVLYLDIVSFCYCLYKDYFNNDNNDNNANNANNITSESNLKVSFNLLKNKISNLLLPNSNQPNTNTQLSNQAIRIIHTPTIIQSRLPNSNIQSENTQQQNLNNDNNNDDLAFDKYMTERMDNSQTQNNNYNSGVTIQGQTGKKSTPISLLRGGNMNTMNTMNTNTMNTNTMNTNTLIPDKIKIVEPIVIPLDKGNNASSGGIGSYDVAESVAGSDVGSMMDLDDFEKTL